MRSIQLTPVSFILVLLLLVSGCASSAVSTNSNASGGERFAGEIAAFADLDSKNAAPFRTVLFTGSSSVRLWKTAESFPTMPVLNRGFGGSHFSDLNNYFDQVVLPSQPEVIVVYEGDNDIASGKTSQDVLDGFMEFTGKVREALPKTRIVFLPVKPSLSRWEMWPQMAEANLWIESVAKGDPLLFYADLATPMLMDDGTPDPSLFLDDGLHLNAKGYALWTKHLAPVLRDARRLPLP